MPAGFAALTTVGGLTTLWAGPAPWTTPIAALLALAGIVLGFTSGPRRIRLSRGFVPAGFLPPALAALAVFLVFGAPVIASGEPGFAGYVKLDDTSTWLAFTDHVLTHGHSVAGLAPSTYEATVQINLSAGYPLGAFVPLGVASRLAGVDPAWSFQPYLAVMAALMALVFFELARPVLARPGYRAVAAAVAAQAPLLVGYAWWGGVKEIATALLAVTLAAGLAAWLPVARPGVEGPPDPEAPPEAEPGAGAVAFLRLVLPLPVFAGAALVGVMGAGGAPWLAGIIAGTVILLLFAVRRRDRGALPAPVRFYLIAGAGLIAGIALLGLPTLFASGHLFSPNQGPLTSGEEMGNLITPLKLSQYAGPWPVGDFRLAPSSGLLTALLVIATVAAAAVGVLAAIRSRAAGLLVAAGGIGAGSLMVWLVGSPWIQGKALATGTASFLLLATVGIMWLLSGRAGPDVRSGPRVAGLLLLVVPVAVVVSNAMAYSHSWLAPHGQLAELEQIGRQFAGQGPALMTEYQPYGVRHFLRNLDAEGASELRRRQVPRRDGTVADKGAWSDTDALVLDPAREGLFTYRTLVLRRNPDQSRPPSPYSLVWQGRYYEVWQRPAVFDPAAVVAHLPLGEGHQPAVVPACAAVHRVAAKAGPGGQVVAAERRPNAVATLDQAPPDWIPDPAAGTLTPLSDGTASGSIEVPRDGRYRVWVGGSTRGRIEVRINGVYAGSAAGQLNNNGQYIGLDELPLAAGPQAVTLRYERGGVLRPATRDYPFGVGPVVIEPVSGSRLLRLPATRSGELCGRSLDWVEAVR